MARTAGSAQGGDQHYVGVSERDDCGEIGLAPQSAWSASASDRHPHDPAA